MLTSTQLAHLCQEVNTQLYTDCKALQAWLRRTYRGVGEERLLLTVSGRERVNLNAALNAYEPTQVLLDETPCVNAQSTRRY